MTLSTTIGRTESELDMAVTAGQELGTATIVALLDSMRAWAEDARELEVQLAEQQSLNAKLRGASAMPQALETARFDNIRPVGGGR